MDTIIQISVIDRGLPSLNKQCLGIKAQQRIVSRLIWIFYLLTCSLFLSTRLNEWRGGMKHREPDLSRLVPQAVLVRHANVNWCIFWPIMNTDSDAS